MNAHHVFIIVIIAAFAEGLGHGELVPDAHIHQAVHRIPVQEFHYRFFQHIKIGHSLVQGITCVKYFPGDHIGKVRNSFRLFEIGSVTEKLYPFLLQLFAIHNLHSFMNTFIIRIAFLPFHVNSAAKSLYLSTESAVISYATCP